MKIKLLFVVAILMCMVPNIFAQDPQLVKRKIDPNSAEGISLKETREGD